MKGLLGLTGKILFIIGIVLNIMMVFFGIWPSLIYLLIAISGFGLMKVSKKDFGEPNYKILKKFISISSYVFLAITCLTIIVYFLSKDFFRKRNTINDCKEIKETLQGYKKMTGVYPDRLSIIIKGFPLRQGWEKDSWGKPYNYRTTNNKSSCILTSAGADGIFFTKDDIITKGN